MNSYPSGFNYKKGFWTSSVSWNSISLDRRSFLKLINSKSETTINQIEVIKQVQDTELDQIIAQSDRPDLSNLKMKYRLELIKTRAGDFKLESELIGTKEFYHIYSGNKSLIKAIVELLTNKQ